MLYEIYSDMHWGQISALPCVEPKEGQIFLGDIFDIKNTAKNIISIQLAKQTAFVKKCQEVGAYYVQGNHDLLKTIPLHVKINNVLFTHGPHVCWDQKQIADWDAKEAKGVGKFRQATLAIQNLYKRGEWSPDLLEIARSKDLARGWGCDTIVLGHTHTKNKVDVTLGGVRIINVPRGFSAIEV